MDNYQNPGSLFEALVEVSPSFVARNHIDPWIGNFNDSAQLSITALPLLRQAAPSLQAFALELCLSMRHTRHTFPQRSIPHRSHSHDAMVESAARASVAFVYLHHENANAP